MNDLLGTVAVSLGARWGRQRLYGQRRAAASDCRRSAARPRHRSCLRPAHVTCQCASVRSPGAPASMDATPARQPLPQGGANGAGRGGDLEAGPPPPPPGEGNDKHMEDFFREVAAIKVRLVFRFGTWVLQRAPAGCCITTKHMEDGFLGGGGIKAGRLACWGPHVLDRHVCWMVWMRWTVTPAGRRAPTLPRARTAHLPAACCPPPAAACPTCSVLPAACLSTFRFRCTLLHTHPAAAEHDGGHPAQPGAAAGGARAQQDGHSERGDEEAAGADAGGCC